jgi:uncharacterized protein (UPF0333 family)
MSHTTTLSNLNVAVPATGAPDYGGGATDFALLCLALIAINSGFFGAAKYTAAGAIAVPAVGTATAFLKAGSAAAMTLAAPVTGAPSAGGQDGVNLTIIAEDAYAYTVTTPANGIVGSKHVATWTAAVGNSIDLVAQGGAWWPAGTPAGVALT